MFKRKGAISNSLQFIREQELFLLIKSIGISLQRKVNMKVRMRTNKMLGALMELSANLVVSILALLVAIASAFYARRAVEQARLSNKINLHEPRKNIYAALIRFRHIFGDYDLHPNDEEIQNFYLHVVLPATIYFPHEISERIYGIYKSSFDFYKRIEDAEYGRSDEAKWAPINEFKTTITNCLDGLIPEVIAVSDVGRT